MSLALNRFFGSEISIFSIIFKFLVSRCGLGAPIPISLPNPKRPKIEHEKVIWIQHANRATHSN